MLVGVNRSKGVLLLGVWVILSNLLPLLSLRIPNSNVLLTVLGVVAGVLLLVDRRPPPAAPAHRRLGLACVTTPGILGALAARAHVLASYGDSHSSSQP